MSLSLLLDSVLNRVADVVQLKGWLQRCVGATFDTLPPGFMSARTSQARFGVAFEVLLPEPWHCPCDCVGPSDDA